MPKGLVRYAKPTSRLLASRLFSGRPALSYKRKTLLKALMNNFKCMLCSLSADGRRSDASHVRPF